MNKLSHKRVKARTCIQYEAAECGAASLATILAYFGRIVELSELRQACGVNRDGSNAKQIIQAGRAYGLSARPLKISGDELKQNGRFPCVVFWDFNHFLVVEGFDNRLSENVSRQIKNQCKDEHRPKRPMGE
jgi:ATP-binding cassette subfamily B protein